MIHCTGFIVNIMLVVEYTGESPKKKFLDVSTILTISSFVKMGLYSAIANVDTRLCAVMRRC
jgi:hypothetical protein